MDAVDVFQQGIAQQIVIFGIAHDGGNGGQASLGGGAPTALTHDELKSALLGGTNDDRLQEAEFADGVNQLAELILIKNGARLLGVGDDFPHGNLAVGRPDCCRRSLPLLGGLGPRALLDGGSALHALLTACLTLAIARGISQDNICGGITQPWLAGGRVGAGRDESGQAFA